MVDLPRAHQGYDLAIDADAGQLLMTFQPGPLDKIAPVIPNAEFSRLKQIQISTVNARGSLSESWRGDRPRALRPPEKIFTESGSYEVLVGPAIGAEDADVDFCSIRYVDAARPPGARAGSRPLARVDSAQITEPLVQGGKLRCEPERVHPGESFVVDLPPDHYGYDLAILAPRGEFLITFNPNRLDTIGPVVSIDEFSKLNRIKISTSEARGSWSTFRQDLPRALAAPQKIFAEPGRYRILLGPALGTYQAGFYACWIDYINHHRPEPKARAGAPAATKIP